MQISIIIPMTLREKLAQLELHKEVLQTLQSVAEKVAYWEKIPAIKEKLQKNIFFSSLFTRLSEKQKESVLAAIGAGQGDRIFLFPSNQETAEKLFFALSAQLEKIHEFYADIGGLIGYQILALSLLLQKKEGLRLLE